MQGVWILFQYPTIPFLLGHPQSRLFVAAHPPRIAVAKINNMAKTILLDNRI
jgi:hypothetical protein